MCGRRLGLPPRHFGMVAPDGKYSFADGVVFEDDVAPGDAEL